MGLYLSPNQHMEEEGNSITGFRLLEELADKPTFNANLLDYLLAHKDLIPEELKADEHGQIRYTCFWGTIYWHEYRGQSYPIVRSLYWATNDWISVARWLGHEFPNFAPATMLIDPPTSLEFSI
ncbi:MAG: hypothetical protein WCF77_01080 [Minisyncoccia bacterium]